MAEWYCAPGGQQIGPFAEEQFREMARAGQVRPEDAVWSQGMADWVVAGTIPWLFPPIRGAPSVPMVVPLQARGSMPMSAGGMPGPAMPLSYATPAAASALPPAPFAAPQYDAGPFEKIGKVFKVNSSRWSGMIVASPVAFYLLKVAQRHHTGYGGLIGYVIATALAKTDDTRTCDLTQLPDPVRQALDPKGKRLQCDVIIVRRDAVSRVKTSWMGIITVRVGTDRFDVTNGMFSTGRIRNFLTANGWTLNAELIPTSAPTHGAGYGRPDGAPPPGMSLGKRIAMILLAIAIFVVVVALRVGCDDTTRGY